MKTAAAIALEAGTPLEIMDVDLDGPRAGEVLVEIKATGIWKAHSRPFWATRARGSCWRRAPVCRAWRPAIM